MSSATLGCAGLKSIRGMLAGVRDKPVASWTLALDLVWGQWLTWLINVIGHNGPILITIALFGNVVAKI